AALTHDQDRRVGRCHFPDELADLLDQHVLADQQRRYTIWLSRRHVCLFPITPATYKRHRHVFHGSVAISVAHPKWLSVAVKKVAPMAGKRRNSDQFG